MKTSHQNSFMCALVMLSIMLLILSSAVYGQVHKMSTKELAQESTAILVGKCTQKESFWNEKHDKIFTRVKIRTGENIKGNLGAEAEIIVPGGRVGNILYEVSDMPIFQEGEEALVFIWRHPSGMNLITGALQGKLTVVKDKKTGKKIVRGGPIKLEEEKSLAKTATPRTTAPKKILLDDFIKEVKDYVKE